MNSSLMMIPTYIRISHSINLDSKVEKSILLAKDHDHIIVQTLFEPLNYEEACTIPAWQIAMQEEVDALTANNTWDMVPLPDKKKGNR